MSHEIPASTPYDTIDTSKPYLVPRKSGQIEVWHVETNEDGTPKVDEKGWVVLSSQGLEPNAEGELSRVSKPAHPEALSDDVQSHFADILGQARPNATPEQFERYEAASEDLAEAALEAVGVDEPISDEQAQDTSESGDSSEHDTEVNKVKESVERMLSGIDETMPRVKDQVKGLNHLLDAVMTQIHYGMSHDESDRQAVSRYAAEVESINMTLNSMLSQVNTLKYKAEGLGYDAFEEGSDAAAAQAKLIETCDTMAKFMHGAYDVLTLMREFANARDIDQAQPAAEALRRTGHDGTMEHLALNQKELVSAFTE